MKFMALKEKNEIDLIEITAIGAIQVREATVILKNGKEISRTFHRYVLLPGADLEGQPARVKAIAKAIWTPEVLSDYKALAQKTLEPTAFA
jgi:hypothetical protein